MPAITDWGTAIFTALTNALNLLLTFIPKFIGFLVILLVGWLVAAGVSRAVTFLLRKIGFDRMSQRIGLTRLEQRMGVTMDPAGVLGKVVYWFIFLIFLVPAADALGIPAVSNVLNSIVAFIPNVFVAILVLFLGTLAATFVADIVRGATATANVGNPNLFANIARYAIIGFSALIALEQINIAPALLNEFFGAIVFALALAVGLAFGLGGRESAQRLLNRSENTISDAASQLSAQQTQEQAHQRQQAYYQQQMAQQAAAQQAAAQQGAYSQPYNNVPAQPVPGQPPYDRSIDNMPVPPAQPPYDRSNPR